MNNASVTYHRELLVPSEAVSLYFKISNVVAVKDLVAAVRFFGDEGLEVLDLKPLSYSPVFSRHFVYLRSPQESVGDWVTATVVAPEPVTKIEIEIIPWSPQFKGEIENVVHGVWAGTALERETTEAPVNFVAIQGNNR